MRSQLKNKRGNVFSQHLNNGLLEGVHYVEFPLYSNSNICTLVNVMRKTERWQELFDLESQLNGQCEQPGETQLRHDNSRIKGWIKNYTRHKHQKN